MSILSVQHVSYIYENTKQPVLKDISVDFEMGKLYSIIGKSGSGKTTFLSLLSGLDACTEGEILYDGKDFIVNQRIIAGNAQFTGIAAGQGVGFTTGLLLLREGLGMRKTPIRPHS